MRDAFTDGLVEERRRRPEVIVLDGDCSRSTRTERFATEFPDSFINAGIAEQSLIGVAAGLALCGFVPVASSFAAIVVQRAFDQIMNSVALPGLPVKIAGHYAGLSAAREGAPHHAIADLALLQSVPGMSIWTPGDDDDARSVAGLMLGSDGPGYIRLSRDATTSQAGGDGTAAAGWRSWGRGRDVLLIGCGAAVAECLTAAAVLSDDGVDATTLSVIRLKPFPEEAVRALASEVALVVVLEEHSRLGGLGSAVHRCLADVPVPIVGLGLNDVFGETGASHRELLEAFGITATAVVGAVRSARRHLVR
jgi:transketolase